MTRDVLIADMSICERYDCDGKRERCWNCSKWYCPRHFVNHECSFMLQRVLSDDWMLVSPSWDWSIVKRRSYV